MNIFGVGFGPEILVELCNSFGLELCWDCVVGHTYVRCTENSRKRRGMMKIWGLDNRSMAIWGNYGLQHDWIRSGCACENRGTLGAERFEI